MFLHADNCIGHNKNNCVLHYLAWQCMAGLHTKVTMSLVVGHTKFVPDWCFGLLKRLCRRMKTGSLADIVQIVDEFAVCNVP